MAVIDTGDNLEFPIQQHYGGPFRDANGNLYWAGKHGAALEVWKSTDDGATWAEQDSGNRPSVTTDLISLWVYQDGDTLHIVLSDTNKDIEYVQFRTSDHASADTYATNEVIHAVSDTVNEEGCSIAIRSDGDRVVFYASATETVHGSQKSRLSIRVHEGTSWTDQDFQQIEDQSDDGAGQFQHPVIVRGASDLMHLFYFDDQTNDLLHRTFSSTNVFAPLLSAAPDTLDANAGGGASRPLTNGVYYDDGGVEVITIGFRQSDNDLDAIELRDNVAETTEEVSDSTDVAFSFGVVSAGLAIDESTGNTVFAFWRDDVTDDLFRDSNADGAGWGTDATELVGTIIKLDIGAGSTSDFIGYVIDVAGGQTYGEFQAGVPADVFPPFRRRQQTTVRM